MSRADRIANRWQQKRAAKLMDRIVQELLRERPVLDGIDALSAAFGKQVGMDFDTFLNTSDVAEFVLAEVKEAVKERLRRGLTEAA